MDAAALHKALNDDEGRKAIPAKEGDAPHYLAIGPGQAIGYRPKRGSWCARARVQLPGQPGGKAQYVQRYTTLAVPAGASYLVAFAAACAWVKEQSGRAPVNAPGLGNVTACLAKYVDHLRLVGAKDEKTIGAIENLFRNATLDPIGAIDCEKLVALDVTEWRERMLRGERVVAARCFKDGTPVQRKAAKLAPSSVNRIKKAVFAALSWAADSGYIINRDWQLKKNLTETISREGRFIEKEHQDLILKATAGTEFGHYLVCIVSSGARPVELERALATDMDVKGKAPTIRLWSKKGKEAKVRERYFGIPAQARVSFAYFGAGKIGMAQLFPYGDNQASLKFTALMVQLGLVGADGKPLYILYDTRHTRIATLLSKGVDAQTVAKVCGTSLQMIDKHYSKYLPKDAAAKVAAVGF